MINAQMKAEMAGYFVTRLQTNLRHRFLSNSVRNYGTIYMIGRREWVLTFWLSNRAQLNELVKNFPLLTQVGSSIFLLDTSLIVVLSDCTALLA